jgi:hypothetical protein
MPYIPKPTKSDREGRNKKRLALLKAYRKSQASLAVYRDGGMCVICHFKFFRDRRMDDVHHVYGRGSREGDWREKYTSLICTCRECHPQPIFAPGSSVELEWVETILKKANAAPINMNFKHPTQD